MANDEKIQKLIDEVKKRKQEIESINSYSFKTNMQLGIMGQKLNLQTLDLDALTTIYAYYAVIAEKKLTINKEFGITTEVVFDGFPWSKWKADIAHKINKLQITKKKQELEKLEERLNKLVSPELRAQLELQEIERELGL